jgi:hypothetical protein
VHDWDVPNAGDADERPEVRKVALIIQMLLDGDKKKGFHPDKL